MYAAPVRSRVLLVQAPELQAGLEIVRLVEQVEQRVLVDYLVVLTIGEEELDFRDLLGTLGYGAIDVERYLVCPQVIDLRPLTRHTVVVRVVIEKNVV